jgi:membrane associated rhomboid family serine protease
MNNYRPNNGLTPAVKWLLIANVAVFFLSMFINYKTGTDTAQMFGLHLFQSDYWRPYQYITHMFMHGSFTHLFFNMFALFMFGRILENVWGTKRFLFYYFVTGIGAAFLHSVVGGIEVQSMLNQYAEFKAAPEPGLLAEFIRAHIPNPQKWVWNLVDEWMSNPNSAQYIEAGKQIYMKVINEIVNIPTIGASGAVFGILLAFGMLFPNSELFIMFIPIPIKAKYFVIGYGLIELFLGIQNSASDNVAHFAHLGGMIFGFILIKYWNKKLKRFY